jgi:acyl transferase domain-containing protein
VPRDLVPGSGVAHHAGRGDDRDPERGAARDPETLARLYVAGADPDWTAAYAGERRQRLALPTYPFRRQCHWPALAASRRPKALSRDAGTRPGGDPAPAAAAVAEGAEIRPRVARASEREARQVMLAHVTGAVAHVSGLDAAELDDPHAGFFDLGLNSLMVVEVRNRLEQTLGLALPPTITFDHPNVAELAEHLVRLVRETGAVPNGGGDVEAAIETELRELEKLLEKPR